MTMKDVMIVIMIGTMIMTETIGSIAGTAAITMTMIITGRVIIDATNFTGSR
jgi:hypothetical protein